MILSFNATGSGMLANAARRMEAAAAAAAAYIAWVVATAGQRGVGVGGGGCSEILQRFGSALSVGALGEKAAPVLT